MSKVRYMWAYFLWLLSIKSRTEPSCPITNHPPSEKAGCTLQPGMQHPGQCWFFNCLLIAASCCAWNMGSNREKPGSDATWGLRHIAERATACGGGRRGAASRKLSWSENKNEFLFNESAWFTVICSLLQANSKESENGTGEWKNGVAF